MDPIIVVAVALGLIILILAILAYALAQAAGKEPPMLSEQPRERKRECAHARCPHRCSAYCRDPKGAQPQPRGEADDLAAQLKQEAMQIRASRDGVFSDGMAEGLDRAASIARASTHPEQWARVDPEQLRLVRNMAKIEASQSDPEQAPAFTDKRRASHRRRADALNAVLAALEPAPPTPTEQENDR